MCFAAGLGLLEVAKSFVDSDGVPTADADRLYRHHRRPSDPATPGQVLEDALVFAAVTGRERVATFLLDTGADINARRSLTTNLPLPVPARTSWP